MKVDISTNTMLPIPKCQGHFGFYLKALIDREAICPAISGVTFHFRDFMLWSPHSLSGCVYEFCPKKLSPNLQRLKIPGYLCRLIDGERMEAIVFLLQSKALEKTGNPRGKS